jgi:hypothetical protein
MTKRIVMINMVMFVIVGLIFSVGCSKNRIEESQQVKDLIQQLQGTDSIAKIKSILEIEKIENKQYLKKFIPGLINALSDKTSIQIPENLLVTQIKNNKISVQSPEDLTEAPIKINTQFGDGSVLRFREGDIFPTGGGSVLIAGKNARLRVSTPAREAAAILKIISGKDLGDDPIKWQEWWKKNKGI